MSIDDLKTSDNGGTGRAEEDGPSPIQPPPQRSAADIQHWMVSYLARHLDTHPDEIDVTAPFEHFALDSATAIEMTGDLEEWLGKRVDPMMAYDYPTIRDMAQYLGGEDARETD
jgi:acyl carrier protein